MQRRLITHEDPKSPISEAYRSLRTSLTYYNTKKECKVILVSSVGPGEGKTTTIANLAITYANLGKKTLLVDSDLRKPVTHNIFKIDKTPGLTSLLCSDSSFQEVIKKTDIDNLDIITSGVVPPNPSELLASEAMIEFINEAKKSYDVILFDSPPLIAVTDAYVLLKNIDEFLLKISSIKKSAKLIDDFNFNGDFIESQAFAYLAIRSYLNKFITFPGTTGVKKPCRGGLIFKN